MEIAELLEIEAIKQLRWLYSHHYDGKRLDDLMALFTDDAVCEFAAAFGEDWVGRDGIRDRFARFLAAEGAEFAVLHVVTNPSIRLVDAETAHGRWYLLDLQTTKPEVNPLLLLGIYDDVYRKIDGRWRIHRMRIDFLWPRREVGEPRRF
jgi:ketosteroid isomerase-like protein